MPRPVGYKGRLDNVDAHHGRDSPHLTLRIRQVLQRPLRPGTPTMVGTCLLFACLPSCERVIQVAEDGSRSFALRRGLKFRAWGKGRRALTVVYLGPLYQSKREPPHGVWREPCLI